MKMKIEIKGNQAHVHTPYNANFVRRVKGIGGAKWEPSGKYWEIPVEAIGPCREIMKEVYGETDIPSFSGKYVSLRLTFTREIRENGSAVTILGKTVCKAYGRDSGGRAGDGVSYVKGRPESGGSVRNWLSVVPAGSVVVLAGVPEEMYKEFDPATIPGLEIEEIKEERGKESLLQERERLLKRLAELDAELARA